MAPADRRHDGPAGVLEARQPGVAAAGPEIRKLAQDAAEIGWGETLRTLLPVHPALAGEAGADHLCGIGRVVAFIAVSALGALVIAAVASGRPSFGLLVALLLAAPVAATLHWLESWLAHDMAYRLLAAMRIALFAKLDRLAPAYLLRRRSGDLVSLATQDVETVEYFYAHNRRPGLRRGADPQRRAGAAGLDRLAAGAGAAAPSWPGRRLPRCSPVATSIGWAGWRAVRSGNSGRI